MSERVDPSKYVVRAGERGPAMRVRHPFNPASEIHMVRLGDRTGLVRQGISVARVPPGKESFVLHSHTLQEEWIFVLSGQGHVVLGDEQVAVAAGDFVGFPIDGTPHLVRNTSADDLVFLQGGERREGDRGVFPTLRKIGWHHDDVHMALADADAIDLVPFTKWFEE